MTVNPLLVVAAGVGGLYAAASVGVGLVTTAAAPWPLLRLNPVVAETTPPSVVRALLSSEFLTTILLWVGLATLSSSAVDSVKVNWSLGLVISGYATLLAWLLVFGVDGTQLSRAARVQGLTATWVVFALSFTAAAAVITDAGAPGHAVGFVWAHAAHRLLLDGWYTQNLRRGYFAASTATSDYGLYPLNAGAR